MHLANKAVDITAVCDKISSILVFAMTNRAGQKQPEREGDGASPSAMQVLQPVPSIRRTTPAGAPDTEQLRCARAQLRWYRDLPRPYDSRGEVLFCLALPRVMLLKTFSIEGDFVMAHKAYGLNELREMYLKFYF